jgi:hypothetical protein
LSKARIQGIVQKIQVTRNHYINNNNRDPINYSISNPLALFLTLFRKETHRQVGIIENARVSNAANPDKKSNEKIWTITSTVPSAVVLSEASTVTASETTRLLVPQTASCQLVWYLTNCVRVCGGDTICFYYYPAVYSPTFR